MSKDLQTRIMLLLCFISTVHCAGCATRPETLTTFETVRMRQAMEGAERNEKQAEQWLEELRANNRKMEQTVLTLRETADRAEAEAELCIQRARDHKITLPASLLTPPWRAR